MTFYKEHYALAQLKCCLKFRSSCWLAGVLQNMSSQKFRKFHWKTPVLESVFNKVASFQAFKPFFREHVWWLLRKFSLVQPTYVVA